MLALMYGSPSFTANAILNGVGRNILFASLASIKVPIFSLYSSFVARPEICGTFSLSAGSFRSTLLMNPKTPSSAAVSAAAAGTSA